MTNDAFSTISNFASEYSQSWPGYQLASEGTERARQALADALHESPGGDRLLGPDVSLVLFGSFARCEMVRGSDYDWSLLIDGVVNSDHAKLAKSIAAALRAKGLIPPGSSGTFGGLVFSHELVHQIGGDPDSNANLTRRILMLLESRPFSISDADSSDEVWGNVLKNILKRYFEADVHFAPTTQRKVPRFLFNDLTRYWRTIGVDYAAKFREQGGRKWAVRNAKLRLSRKLLYASRLAFCLSCHLAPPEVSHRNLFGITQDHSEGPFIDRALAFARTPALEYLAAFVDSFVKEPDKRKRIALLLFGSYSSWLELMNDEARRKELQELSHEQVDSSPVFEAIRTIGSEFAKGLELLFFNFDRELEKDPIAQLCLQYIGF